MACFAAYRSSVGIFLLHAIFELPAMWICMAARTTQALPVVDHNRLRLELI
jgi:hypothetical protein